MAKSAKYLGIKCGLRAQDESWAAPLVKYRDRCRFIKSLKLGLSLSLRAYNQIAVSVLMYVAQLFPPTADCDWQVHLGLQSLTCAPRHALPDHMLVNLNALGGKHVRARSFQHEARAAAYRAVLASSVFFFPFFHFFFDLLILLRANE